MAEGASFSRKILSVGFATGLFLSFVCFLASAFYLHQFQQAASQSVATALDLAQQAGNSSIDSSLVQFSLSAHIFIAQVLLRSCGIFAGLAFGFLGFSLFLIGVQGNIDADVSVESKIKISLLRISPGALVIVAATFLIGICAVSSVPGSLSQSQTTNATASGQSQVSIQLPDTETDSSGMDMRGLDEIDNQTQGPANNE